MRREVKCLGFLLICIVASAWIIGRLSYDIEFEYGTLYDIEVQAKNEPPADAVPVRTIQVFLIIPDFKTLEKALTMLKSLLYYQGHLDETFDECIPTFEKPESLRCSETELLPTSSSVVLHVVASEDLGDQTAELFGEFHVEELTVQLYSLEDCLQMIGIDRYARSTESVEMLKLFSPKILGDEVEKVMLLDANLLIVANIDDLWDRFDQFRTEQAVGAICEHVPDCSRSSATSAGEFCASGINTGVILLNLNVLRRVQWWNMADVDEDRLEEEQFDIQEPINRVLANNQQLYHPLPCRWNIQITTEASSLCCPFFWVDRYPEEEDCVNTEDENQTYAPMARAIQFNIDRKIDLNLLINGYSGTDLNLLLNTAQKFQIRFENTYKKFQQLASQCFA